MKKLKTSLVIMLAMIMVVGTQPRTVFADEEENIAKDLSVGVENKENEEKTEKVGSEFVDEGNVASENEGMGTEIVDVENEESVDGGVEAYTESDEVGTNVDEEIPKAGTCGDNLTWTLSDDGILMISGNGPMRDYTREEGGEVDFPPAYAIRALVVEDGVTSIGNHAFSGCPSMEKVILPNSITSIGEEAFFRCLSLTEIEIPDSVIDIGEYAFWACYNLSRVKLSNNISNIKQGTFYMCSLEEIEIPENVVEIGDLAFYLCQELKHVVLSKNLKAIGDNAFDGCTALTQIVIPEGIKNIGNRTFNSSGLMEVVIPANVSTIGLGAFSHCLSLKSIRFEGNAPEIAVAKEESELEAFQNVTANVYYPENNPTWTADKMQNYGGTLIWHPWNLYIVEEATDSVYVKGSSNGATIKCTEELGKFISVAMDGVILDSSNYTVVEGSTVLTFLSSYLDTLSVGDHVITLNYTYGSIDTTLTVLDRSTNTSDSNTMENDNETNTTGNANASSNSTQDGAMQSGTPKTGDHTLIMLWGLVMITAGCGCPALIWTRKQKRA